MDDTIAADVAVATTVNFGVGEVKSIVASTNEPYAAPIRVSSKIVNYSSFEEPTHDRLTSNQSYSGSTEILI